MASTVAPHGPLPKLQNDEPLQLGALVFDESDLLDVSDSLR